MTMHVRAAASLAVVLSAACAQSGAPSWSGAQAMWDARKPHSWTAWSIVAAQPDGAAAKRRLDEAARLYEDGVRALERGEPDASSLLRQGAEIAPIDPLYYLRLARACRAQGALVRAADFYRKLLVEDPPPDVRAIATVELAQIDRGMGDPFIPAVSPPDRRVAIAPAICLLVARAFIGLRRRRIDIAFVLEQHPERAAAFAYQADILRHELFKHRLAAWRVERRHSEEPIVRVWRRHVDVIGVTLGLPRSWARREPHFAAADRAIAQLASGTSREAPMADIAALDRQLIAWVRLSRHTRVDGRLLEAIVDSIRDERPDGIAGVELKVREPSNPPTAAIFVHDLLLVARNLARNAVAAAQGAGRVLLDVTVHVDDVGQEWVRLAVHDSSRGRPDVRAPIDQGRGLGIVRVTLERYGGALLELPSMAGYEKALVASIPLAEESAAAAAQHSHGELAA